MFKTDAGFSQWTHRWIIEPDDSVWFTLRDDYSSHAQMIYERRLDANEIVAGVLHDTGSVWVVYPIYEVADYSQELIRAIEEKVSQAAIEQGIISQDQARTAKAHFLWNGFSFFYFPTLDEWVHPEWGTFMSHQELYEDLTSRHLNYIDEAQAGRVFHDGANRYGIELFKSDAWDYSVPEIPSDEVTQRMLEYVAGVIRHHEPDAEIGTYSWPKPDSWKPILQKQASTDVEWISTGAGPPHLGYVHQPDIGLKLFWRRMIGDKEEGELVPHHHEVLANFDNGWFRSDWEQVSTGEGVVTSTGDVHVIPIWSGTEVEQKEFRSLVEQARQAALEWLSANTDKQGLTQHTSAIQVVKEVNVLNKMGPDFLHYWKGRPVIYDGEKAYVGRHGQFHVNVAEELGLPWETASWWQDDSFPYTMGRLRSDQVLTVFDPKNRGVDEEALLEAVNTALYGPRTSSDEATPEHTRTALKWQLEDFGATGMPQSYEHQTLGPLYPFIVYNGKVYVGEKNGQHGPLVRSVIGNPNAYDALINDVTGIGRLTPDGRAFIMEDLTTWPSREETLEIIREQVNPTSLSVQSEYRESSGNLPARVLTPGSHTEPSNSYVSDAGTNQVRPIPSSLMEVAKQHVARIQARGNPPTIGIGSEEGGKAIRHNGRRPPAEGAQKIARNFKVIDILELDDINGSDLLRPFLFEAMSLYVGEPGEEHFYLAKRHSLIEDYDSLEGGTIAGVVDDEGHIVFNTQVTPSEEAEVLAAFHKQGAQKLPQEIEGFDILEVIEVPLSYGEGYYDKPFFYEKSKNRLFIATNGGHHEDLYKAAVSAPYHMNWDVVPGEIAESDTWINIRRAPKDIPEPLMNWLKTNYPGLEIWAGAGSRFQKIAQDFQTLDILNKTLVRGIMPVAYDADTRTWYGEPEFFSHGGLAQIVPEEARYNHRMAWGRSYIEDGRMKVYWHSDIVGSHPAAIAEANEKVDNLFRLGQVREGGEGEVIDESGRVKYPRTYHLPWSSGRGEDDVGLDIVPFEGKEVVITEKLDGENTTMYNDYIHSRSMDSDYHPTRTMVKKLHGEIGYQIPEGWRIVGENMQGLHSISYELPSVFYIFAVFDENNICLSWDDTEMIADMLGIPTVPVIYRGPWDEQMVQELSVEPSFSEEAEGYVVRVSHAFPFESFSENVAKFVREDHIQTDDSWLTRPIPEYNKINLSNKRFGESEGSKGKITVVGDPNKRFWGDGSWTHAFMYVDGNLWITSEGHHPDLFKAYLNNERKITQGEDWSEKLEALKDKDVIFGWVKPNNQLDLWSGNFPDKTYLDVSTEEDARRLVYKYLDSTAQMKKGITAKETSRIKEMNFLVSEVWEFDRRPVIYDGVEDVLYIGPWGAFHTQLLLEMGYGKGHAGQFEADRWASGWINGPGIYGMFGYGREEIRKRGLALLDDWDSQQPKIGVMKKSLAPVPTALTKTESDVLSRLATGKDVLEVGSLLGASTIVMAQVARSVTSVDPHVGYPYNDPKSTLDPFIKNLEDYGVKEKVDIYQGTDAILNDIDKDYDFIFIDATGMYDDTYRIMERSLAWLRPGGVLAVHDFMREDWPEATFAVHQFSTDKGLNYKIVDTLAIISTSKTAQFPNSSEIGRWLYNPETGELIAWEINPENFDFDTHYDRLTQLRDERGFDEVIKFRQGYIYDDGTYTNIYPMESDESRFAFKEKMDNFIRTKWGLAPRDAANDPWEFHSYIYVGEPYNKLIWTGTSYHYRLVAELWKLIMGDSSFKDTGSTSDREKFLKEVEKIPTLWGRARYVNGQWRIDEKSDWLPRDINDSKLREDAHAALAEVLGVEKVYYSKRSVHKKKADLDFNSWIWIGHPINKLYWNGDKFHYELIIDVAKDFNFDHNNVDAWKDFVKSYPQAWGTIEKDDEGNWSARVYSDWLEEVLAYNDGDDPELPGEWDEEVMDAITENITMVRQGLRHLSAKLGQPIYFDGTWYDGNQLERISIEMERKIGTTIEIVDNPLSEWHGGGQPFIYEKATDTIYVGKQEMYHIDLFESLGWDGMDYKLGWEPDWYVGGRVENGKIYTFFNELPEKVKNTFDVWLENKAKESHIAAQNPSEGENKFVGYFLDNFGYIDGKLYIGKRHHADILARWMEEEGLTWEDYSEILNTPTLFGWLRHSEYDEESSSIEDIPTKKRDFGIVIFNTDTDTRQNKELKNEVIKLLELHYEFPVKEWSSEENFGVNYPMSDWQMVRQAANNTRWKAMYDKTTGAIIKWETDSGNGPHHAEVIVSVDWNAYIQDWWYEASFPENLEIYEGYGDQILPEYSWNYSEEGILAVQEAALLPNEKIKQAIFGKSEIQHKKNSQSIPTVNPVGYIFPDFSTIELNAWYDLDSRERQWWSRKAKKLNEYANAKGAMGRVNGKRLFALWNRFEGRCAYDGLPGADSWDHVIPIGEGGSNTIDNLLPAHIRCNQELNEWTNRLSHYVKSFKQPWRKDDIISQVIPTSANKLKVFDVKTDENRQRNHHAWIYIPDEHELWIAMDGHHIQLMQSAEFQYSLKSHDDFSESGVVAGDIDRGSIVELWGDWDVVPEDVKDELKRRGWSGS